MIHLVNILGVALAVLVFGLVRPWTARTPENASPTAHMVRARLEAPALAVEWRAATCTRHHTSSYGERAARGALGMVD